MSEAAGETGGGLSAEEDVALRRLLEVGPMPMSTDYSGGTPASLWLLALERWERKHDTDALLAYAAGRGWSPALHHIANQDAGLADWCACLWPHPGEERPVYAEASGARVALGRAILKATEGTDG